MKRRDRVVLPWIAEQYAAGIDQVQELLSRMPGRGGKPVSETGLTMSAVLQVVDRWVTLGLVEYRRIYEGEPGWIHLTSSGLRTLHLPYTCSPRPRVHFPTSITSTACALTWSAATQTFVDQRAHAAGRSISA